MAKRPPLDGESREVLPDQLDLFAEMGNSDFPASEVAEAPCAFCVEKFMSDIDVAARYSVSRSTVWRWVDVRPGFPKPNKLSPCTSRWRMSELAAFEKLVAKAPLQ